MHGLFSFGLASVVLVNCGGGNDKPQESTDGTIGTGGSGAGNTGGKSSTSGSSGAGGVAGSSAGATGTGGSSGSSNVLDVVVDEGLPNTTYINGLFTTVTLCEPGKNSCQSIDHVLVDTGSVGLRVLETAITLSLPAIKDTSGATLAECAQFVSGTSWGPVVVADVKLGGETAAAIPIQTIGETKYPMPSTGACASGTPLNDVAALGSNGVLGVGIYQQDCGAACTQTRGNPGMYFACTSNQAGACKTTAVSLNLQPMNPIVAFPVDKNGLIIQLPSVPAKGSPSVSGKLVFGIGTQSNNALGAATVVTPIDPYGTIGTTFPVGGTQYAAVIDSGSNAFYFLDSAKSGLALCATTNLKDFYCPPTTTSLSATIYGNNSATALVSFSVANISTLSATSFAFNNVAGVMPGYPSTDPGAVDVTWGLPFFYGRNVYTAIDMQDTPGGKGPYVAF
jgi:hypothetical protein